MRFGRMYKSGDIILANIQFTDTFEMKQRPALILFEEYDNIVVAGITSNNKMEGIPLSKKEGAIKESTIKLNYIFTISKILIKKKLFTISKRKKKIVFQQLTNKLTQLNS